MAWAASSNDLGGYDFYLQNDTGWEINPTLNFHTPLGSQGSIVHWAGTPAETRVISGFMCSLSDRQALQTLALAGTKTTFNTEDCYIQQLSGGQQDVENLDYLDLVTIRLAKDRVPA